MLLCERDLLCSPGTDTEEDMLSYSAAGKGLEKGRFVEEKA